ncbi:hypothetical protein BK142_14370 [Paenibacillus glucanolyticus]|nr:hypothetical protein BK142_14370 [Paenibacillus glucanolyticus]
MTGIIVLSVLGLIFLVALILMLVKKGWPKNDFDQLQATMLLLCFLLCLYMVLAKLDIDWKF